MTEPAETPAPQAPSAPPEPPASSPADLRLRGQPPKVMRLSRKVLAVMGLMGGVAVGGSLIYALKPTPPKQAEELYNTESRSTPDNLASVPKDYGQAPKLGPPLPGDLGRPIVAAQERGTNVAAPPIGASSNAATTPAATAAQAARQRVAQERDTARTSKLFLASAAASGTDTPAAGPGPLASAAPVASAPVSGDAAASTGQGEKRAFLSGEVDHRTVSLDRLTVPPSPNTVQAGSVIAAVLITGIHSDLPGQITAQVTQNVYDSPTGRILLIPQGSKLIGDYDSQVGFGQRRVLLAWNRLILPDGRSITLERQPGADAAGYSGLQDGVDNHWGRLFKAAILSTMLSVGSEAGTSQDENNLAQAIRSGAANSFSQTGQQIVSRELNIQPTLTIRPGFPVRVIVTRDLVLEPLATGGGR